MMLRSGRLKECVNHVAHPLIRPDVSGHNAGRAGRATVEGKEKFVFPILATGVVVFIVSCVVTFTNIGFRADFVRCWLSAFIIGWPVASITGLIAFPYVRRVTMFIVSLIEGA